MNAAAPDLSNLTTKEKLLATARHLFLTKGYHPTSNAEIARISGLVPSAIYKHYQGKRGLLDELIKPQIRAYELVFNPHPADFFNWILQSRSTREVCIRLHKHNHVLDFFETLEKDRELSYFSLTQLQGTKYEFLLKDLAVRRSKYTIQLLELLQQRGFSLPPYSEAQISIFVETQLYSYVHTLGLPSELSEKKRLYHAVHSYYFLWWASLIDQNIHDFLSKQQYLSCEPLQSI